MREQDKEWAGGPGWGALTYLRGLPEGGRGGKGGEAGREVRGPPPGRQGFFLVTAVLIPG